MLGDRAKNSILRVFPEFFLVPIDSYPIFSHVAISFFTQWDVLSGYVVNTLFGIYELIEPII